MGRSNSSVAAISLADRCRYYWQVLNVYREGAAFTDMSDLPADFQRLDSCARRYCGATIGELKALEIGFGARPYRLAYLRSRGVDVVGIDLDQPLLTGSASEALSIASRNGPLRAAKSLARYWIFERNERQNDASPMAPTQTLEAERLIVGDAGTPAPWAKVGQRHLIYSFRVFEHMDIASLESMLGLMQQHIQPSGFCYIVVTAYTGIIGGHLPEWYPDRLHRPGKRSKPWEHLRGGRFRADTYLNKLTRRQYAELFSRYFAVLQDEPLQPGLGREFLTDEVREELSDFDEYELLSNDVIFLLRACANA